MRNLFYKILGVIVLAASFTSCDFFAIDAIDPIDAVATSEAIIDLQTARTARAGIYDRLQLDAPFDGYLSSWQYYSDECDWTGTFPTRAQFDSYNVQPSNNTMSGYFTDFYQVSNSANTFIEAVNRVEDPALTEADKNSMIGEARFARAFVYFHLVQGWGDVPLVLTPTTSREQDFNVPTSPAADVMTQVIDDLEFAAANIQLGGIDAPSIGITPAAANALLARIALYQERYDDALSLATGVLGDDFDLSSFNYLEDEIFFIEFNAADGNSFAFFYGTSALNGRHSIEPSATLIAAYEEGDERFDASIGFTGATPYGNKYNDFASAGGSQNDPLRMLRHAEQVLIAAEAAARMGDFDTAESFFNQVRNRAGLDDLELDEDNFEDLILQERFVELAMESGHRLWDLRRTGKALEVLGPGGYEECADVWPLPQREIDRNTVIVQNNCCNC